MLDKNEKQEPERISGTVDGIVAYKPESGFVVFDIVLFYLRKFVMYPRIIWLISMLSRIVLP